MRYSRACVNQNLPLWDLIIFSVSEKRNMIKKSKALPGPAWIHWYS